ncbi:MAG: homocysteine S-methyltransferase family protein [Candidatus Binatia bacterium]
MLLRPPFLEAVRTRVLVGDGAMGTQLFEAGLPVGACGDEWNLSHADTVGAIHSAYASAGSDVLLTNTFQASPLALARHGLAAQAYAINLSAARIARDCAGPSRYVLGDIGPFGGFLQPLGSTSRAELEDAVSIQAAGLVDGGVDGIIIETMTALDELGAVAQAVRRVRPDVPLVGSLTFDRLVDGGFRTMTGVDVPRAVGFMEQLGFDILGCNCGTGIHVGDYVQLVEQYREVTKRPIMVQPNAGQPRLERGHIVYDETAEMMAAAVPALIRAGASIVGSCCGTGPEHIRLFRRQADAVAAPGGAAASGRA